LLLLLDQLSSFLMAGWESDACPCSAAWQQQFAPHSAEPPH